MEIVWYLALRMMAGALNLLPYRWRLGLVSTILRVGIGMLPRYRRIAHRNLSLAFPLKDITWRRTIIKEHCSVLARVVVDFLRMPQLNRQWVEEHIHFSQLERFKSIRAESGPVLLLAGHFGSFELLPFCMITLVAPMAFVIRKFKQARLNSWWNNVRTREGNVVINKHGAMREIQQCLERGLDVGILFDQNVIRKHAVFVPWFGRNAATTKAIGLTVLRKKVPVLLFSIQAFATERYEIDMQEINFLDITSNDQLSNEEQVERITSRIVSSYERMIQAAPAQWFWFHRRWKTTPSINEPEDFYS